jgi:hypothetical protein
MRPTLFGEAFDGYDPFVLHVYSKSQAREYGISINEYCACPTSA